MCGAADGMGAPCVAESVTFIQGSSVIGEAATSNLPESLGPPDGTSSSKQMFELSAGFWYKVWR